MPLVMGKEDLAHAQMLLGRAWALQAGRATAGFEEDLQDLAGWFDPKLRGQTLREKLAALPPLDAGAARLPATILMPCGDDRYLVTPEGRAWLECSRAPHSETGGQVVFASTEVAPLEQELLATYRRWTRHRLEDVIEKRTGAGSPMLPTAAGLVLMLLVNRSLDPDTAIRRVRDPARQSKIDDVVADVLESFADVLGGMSKRGRRREHFSLWSGYPLTEARRRLAGWLVLDADAGFVYVERASEEQVIDFVARDIARRRGADQTTVDAAFSALVDAYRRRLADLSELGSGFERVGRTDALRERLLRAVRDRP
jgi:hypothetical protein